MFDVGLPELLVIVIVALVIVGPKDLPRVVRGFARTIARMRRMVDEFMGTVNDYVRESELQELRDAVEKTRRAMKGQGNFDDLLDPVGTNKPVVVNDPKVAPETPELAAPDTAADAAPAPVPASPGIPGSERPGDASGTETASSEPAPKPEGQGTP
ncbi:Sec-independent protein translocase protein TatB [Emcibacter sp. SYSU 3D8]|uniref:Sec-independent protein translocase protein TatB n=1 Tax=Emcibacter sp. SYSU 3D8 TaxID=3133969 RepID=UPI0031FEE800